MKKIKEVKLKQDIRTPESFIPKGTIGKVTKYADYLGGELCKFTNGITDAIYQCKVRDTQDLPDWFDITYEPEFKVGDWVKVVREIELLNDVIMDCKLKLRPLSDLTEGEKIEINKMIRPFKITQEIGLNEILRDIKFYGYSLKKLFDYLRSINIDIDGFIEAGKAVAE